MKRCPRGKGIKAATVASYSPQPNGRAEGMVETIKRDLSKMGIDSDWDEQL